MADHDDPFRYCIYCGADCEDAHIVEPDHAADCPSTTGLWPVTERELNLCPHCHVPIHGFGCGECKTQFKIGDHYVLQNIRTGEIERRPEYGVVMCVGCAAQVEALR